MSTPTINNDPRADELLAIRCQLGERTAFEALIGRWHEPLWRYLRRLSGNDDVARDLAQDTWLRVLRGIASLREPARLRPWLFGIARRVAMDRLRFEYSRCEADDVDFDELPAAEFDPDVEAEGAALAAGLATLAIPEREALTLFYLRELTIEEIAALLGVPLGTVKSRLFRARHSLRRELIYRRYTMNPQNESVNAIRELARGELSMKARLGYVALLLAAAGMTGVIVSLWLTEPVLSPRTHAAFGVMSVIGASWVALATWALMTRRVLFARDRVIAGKLAVAFTCVFVVGALAAVITTRSGAAWGALATGAIMLVAAVAVLRRARRRFLALSARRMELERMLGAAG